MGVGVRRNPNRGRDLELYRPATPADTFPVEVKLLHDCTYGHYYPNVAKDRERVRPNGFQVVFFTQLPSFKYPSGCWYGSSKPEHARRTNCIGIQTQFRKLTSHLRYQPTWPENGPLTHPLPFPTEIVTDELLLRRYAEIFVPAVPWAFRGVEQLRDARVGVAIWQVE